MELAQLNNILRNMAYMWGMVESMARNRVPHSKIEFLMREAWHVQTLPHRDFVLFCKRILDKK